jgi:hypothetical protein
MYTVLATTKKTKFCNGECQDHRPIGEFYYLDRAKRYLRSKCKKCLLKANGTYRAEHLDECREREREGRARAYHADVEAARADHRRQAKQYIRRLRAEVLEKLGGTCVRCGFSDPRALQVDHIHGGGGVERRILGNGALLRKVLADTKGLYQLLCANCNSIKRYEEKEGCTEC